MHEALVAVSCMQQLKRWRLFLHDTRVFLAALYQHVLYSKGFELASNVVDSFRHYLTADRKNLLNYERTVCVLVRRRSSMFVLPK